MDKITPEDDIPPLPEGEPGQGRDFGAVKKRYLQVSQSIRKRRPIRHRNRYFFLCALTVLLLLLLWLT